jgi:hypothetical protein
MESDVPRLYLRSELQAAGFTDSEVRRQRKAGTLQLVRRGAYVRTDDAELREREVRHALAVRAELPRLAASAVVSHSSAALLHGLPVWGLPLERVHVTRRRRSGGRVGTAVHVHTAPLSSGEIVAIDGNRGHLGASHGRRRSAHVAIRTSGRGGRCRAPGRPEWWGDRRRGHQGWQMARLRGRTEGAGIR